MTYHKIYSIFLVSCSMILAGCNSMPALHSHALNGDANQVRTLINDGKDINLKNDSGPSFAGYTPLLMAINNGHEDLTNYLIDKGADINIASNSGLSPLHVAAFNGMTSLVQTLLSRGASLSRASSNGSTPLHHAVMSIKNTEEVIDLLLAAGADVNGGANTKLGTPLMVAALYGNTVIADKLISNGADPKLTNAIGNTALHVASMYGRLNAANLLLRQDIDINAMNKVKNTPLHLAAINGRRMVAEQLIKNKADMSVLNEKDESPLDCATNNEKETVVKLLKHHQALI